MLTYRHGGRPVYIDPDMGLGRRYGYRDPARAADDPGPVPPSSPARCHPDRQHVAHGLCNNCYQSSRKDL